MSQTSRASQAINKLAWRAYVDTSFREALLNGSRRETVATLDLTDEEREAVLAARGDTLESFTRDVCQVTGRSAHGLPALCGKHRSTAARVNW